MSQWKTIDTAPKDGSEILGWREDCGILLIRWISLEDYLTDTEAEELAKKTSLRDDDFLAMMASPDWFCADFIEGGRLEGSEVPTHWMPLPADPTEAPSPPPTSPPFGSPIDELLTGLQGAERDFQRISEDLTAPNTSLGLLIKQIGGSETRARQCIDSALEALTGVKRPLRALEPEPAGARAFNPTPTIWETSPQAMAQKPRLPWPPGVSPHPIPPEIDPPKIRSIPDLMGLLDSAGTILEEERAYIGETLSLMHTTVISRTFARLGFTALHPVTFYIDQVGKRAWGVISLEPLLEEIEDLRRELEGAWDSSRPQPAYPPLYLRIEVDGVGLEGEGSADYDPFLDMFHVWDSEPEDHHPILQAIFPEGAPQ